MAAIPELNIIFTNESVSIQPLHPLLDNKYLRINIIATSDKLNIRQMNLWIGNSLIWTFELNEDNDITRQLNEDSNSSYGNNLLIRITQLLQKLSRNEINLILDEYEKYIGNGTLLDGFLSGLVSYIALIFILEYDIFLEDIGLHIPLMISSENVDCLSQNSFTHLSIALSVLSQISTGYLLQLTSFVTSFINMWECIFISGTPVDSTKLCVEIVTSFISSEYLNKRINQLIDKKLEQYFVNRAELNVNKPKHHRRLNGPVNNSITLNDSQSHNSSVTFDDSRSHNNSITFDDQSNNNSITFNDSQSNDKFSKLNKDKKIKSTNGNSSCTNSSNPNCSCTNSSCTNSSNPNCFCADSSCTNSSNPNCFCADSSCTNNFDSSCSCTDTSCNNNSDSSCSCTNSSDPTRSCTNSSDPTCSCTNSSRTNSSSPSCSCTNSSCTKSSNSSCSCTNSSNHSCSNPSSSCTNSSCTNSSCTNSSCTNSSCTNSSCTNSSCTNSSCTNSSCTNSSCTNSPCSKSFYIDISPKENRDIPLNIITDISKNALDKDGDSSLTTTSYTGKDSSSINALHEDGSSSSINALYKKEVSKMTNREKLKPNINRQNDKKVKIIKNKKPKISKNKKNDLNSYSSTLLDIDSLSIYSIEGIETPNRVIDINITKHIDSSKAIIPAVIPYRAK